MSHQTYLSTKYFRSLDGLRAISIIAVVWHHAIVPNSSFWFPFLYRGYLGVDMFFVLSGFLIVTLLLRERDTTGTISIKNFYMRRTLRIFPLYYGVLLLLGVLFALKPASTQATNFFDLLPTYLTYTSNWFHSQNMMAIAWSLSTEEQFYIVWPFVEKILGGAIALPAVGIVFVLNQIVNFGGADHLFNGWIGTHRPLLEILQTTFTPMCFGVVAAHLLHTEKGFRSLQGLQKPYWSIVLLIGTLGLTNLFEIQNIGALHRLIIQLSMTFLLVSCVIQEKHGLHRIFTNVAVVQIATVSYGMYLLHLIVMGIVMPLLQPLGLYSTIPLFIGTFGLTMILSELSFRYYETPFLKLKHVFATRSTSPTTVHEPGTSDRSR
jgi:peptidoglycan/LPS O-acetylase OafA/YrhL